MFFTNHTAHLLLNFDRSLSPYFVFLLIIAFPYVSWELDIRQAASRVFWEVPVDDALSETALHVEVCERRVGACSFGEEDLARVAREPSAARWAACIDMVQAGESPMQPDQVQGCGVRPAARAGDSGVLPGPSDGCHWGEGEWADGVWDI